MSGGNGALGIAAIASAVGFLAAAIVATIAAAAARPSLRRIARGVGTVAALPLLLLAARPAAQPLVAFAVVAALPAPQPLALALAAGAAMMAALTPASGFGSTALVLAGGAAAIAAHALGRSLSAYLAAGRDVAWPASAAGVLAGGLVIGLDGGRALRWGYAVVSGPARSEAPDAGLVLGLALLASLAGALLLGADALAVPASNGPAPSASPLARMLGRRALMLAAGLSLIAAGLVFRAAGGPELFSPDVTRDLGALVVAAGLLSCAVPPLLAERTAGDAVDDEQAGTVISRFVVVVALAAVLAAAAEGWLRTGTYLTPLTVRLLSAALVAFAASETVQLRAPARTLALAGLVIAVLRA